MTEYGFFHPQRGYWQTTGEPPQDIRDNYPAGTIEVPLRSAAHWDWNGSAWVEGTPPAEPVPSAISKRQLILGARRAGWITDAEAEAWATSTALPQVVTRIIAQMPTAVQIDARITALTMSEARRDDQLILAAAAAVMPNATDAERVAAADDAFRQWSKI